MKVRTQIFNKQTKQTDLADTKIAVQNGLKAELPDINIGREAGKQLMSWPAVPQAPPQVRAQESSRRRS